MFKWIKYYCIITKATLTNKTMVYMFGDVWIVSGNVVKKFGGQVIMWIFWILHFIALLFFPLALFITIPLHVIANKK